MTDRRSTGEGGQGPDRQNPVERDADRQDAADASGDGSPLDPATQRRAVRERYSAIATAGDDDGEGCCSGASGSGGASCGDASGSNVDGTRSSVDPSESGVDARQLGYAESDADAVVSEADLGLGCGNPNALAALEAGETVLDLGSGAGFDCFLAAREVGPDGHVIGVDMTPAMVEKARENATREDSGSDDDRAPVDFRLGEIEHLPVADATVDAVISNCVINLSPDKAQVFREAHRVLRPGGRIAVSDVVLTADVPADRRGDPDSVAGCVAGAARMETLESMLEAAGFADVSITPDDDSDAIVRQWDADLALEEYVVAASITAHKPAARD